MHRRLSEKRFVFFAWAVFIAVLCGSVNIAMGCAVPVFRYALERWESDAYIVTVNRGENPSEEIGQACELLDNFSSGDNQYPANVVMQEYKLTDKVKLASGQMAVHFPHASRIEKPIWVGEISEKAVKAIVDSPIRAEIAKRLVGGDSAVWIFLESTDPKKNKAVFEFVEKKLKEIQEKLILVDAQIAAENGLEIAEENEHVVRTSFTMIKLARDNADEQFFIDLLLDSERGLRENDDEPILFPVFGRGILMHAMVGDDVITEANLGDSCLFLTGPCSCEVKELNPGLDMLFQFNWDNALKGSLIIKDIKAPKLEGLGAVVQAVGDVKVEAAEEVEVEAAVDVEVVTAEASDNRLLRNVLVLLVILALIVGGGTWALGQRKR